MSRNVKSGDLVRPTNSSILDGQTEEERRYDEGQVEAARILYQNGVRGEDFVEYMSRLRSAANVRGFVKSATNLEINGTPRKENKF